MTIQDMILVVQMETKTGAESRIKPADWVRWALDAITEAFSVDGALRIQTDMTVLSTPYTIDPNADPSTAYDLPASLLPYHIGLESYIKFRYHSSDPGNADEKAEAVKSYEEFLRILGIRDFAAPVAKR
jgi:hypothetical protein